MFSSIRNTRSFTYYLVFGIVLVCALAATTLMAQFTDPSSVPLHTGSETQGKRGTLAAVELVATDRVSADQYCDVDGKNCVAVEAIVAMLRDEGFQSEDSSWSESERQFNEEESREDTRAASTGLRGLISAVVSDVVRTITGNNQNTTNNRQSCEFNGTTLQNGDTVTAYHRANVPDGATCVPQVRECINGRLTGNFTNLTCDGVIPDMSSQQSGGSDVNTGSGQSAETRGSLRLVLDNATYNIGTPTSFTRADVLQYCVEFNRLNSGLRVDCLLNDSTNSNLILVDSSGIQGTDLGRDPIFPDSTAAVQASDTAGCMDMAAKNYDANATIAGECEYVISNPDWNSGGGFTTAEGVFYEGWNDGVCSECGDQYCALNGYDRAVETKEADKAGQLEYGCWEPGTKSLGNCAPCWEEPWATNGCNILVEVTCAAASDDGATPAASSGNQTQTSGATTNSSTPVIQNTGTGENSDPYGPLVILGDALVGEVLTARPNSVMDDDGINAATKAYQWLRNGSPVQGATSQTYTVQAADAGSAISVRYSYTDNLGNNESVTSKPKPTVPGSSAQSSTNTSNNSGTTNQTSGNTASNTPNPSCSVLAIPSTTSTGKSVALRILVENANDSTLHREVGGGSVEEYSFLGTGTIYKTITITENTNFHVDVWRQEADGSFKTGSCNASVNV